MKMKNVIIGGVVGGIVFFLVGYLFYGLLLMDFFEGQSGSATGVMKEMEDMNWPLLVLGNICAGLLIAYIFERWAGIKTFNSGLGAGAIIGLLSAAWFDLVGFSTANIMTINGALMDIVVTTIMMAIMGGVVGLLLGKMK